MSKGKLLVYSAIHEKTKHLTMIKRYGPVPSRKCSLQVNVKRSC